MTKREFLDTVFALAPNEANAIIDAFDEYVDSNKKIDCDKMDKCEKLQLPPANNSEIPNSFDTISRQAAIDALTEYGNGRAVFISVGEAIIRIEQLPPTQPEPSQVAKDIARILENEQDMRVIAQPEIIRCKDCKHRWTYKCMDSMPIERCDLGQTFYDAEVDYCSLAERREVTT